MLTRRLFAIASASLSLSLAAALPRPSWQWTLSDRLAARSARIAERLRQVPPGGEARLEGGVEPELFLPFEVYDNFLQRAFDDDLAARQRARRLFEERAASLGLGGELWPAATRTASALLQSRRAQRSLARGLPGASAEERARILARIAVLQQGNCAARAAAFAAARAALGGERFDRFLYVAVAPDMYIRARSPGDSTRLRFIQGGCS